MRKDDSVWKRFPNLKNIPEDRFPQHILIIPDGNGRWAKRIHSLPVVGHKKGAEVLKKVIRNLQELPVSTITVWGFSADNWKRSNDEIKGLMAIFEETIKEMADELMDKNVRFFHLGRKDRIPHSLKEIIEKTENMTKKNSARNFCAAIDFGGQDQELRMMEAIRKLPKNKKITLDIIEKLRDGNGNIAPADLIIRTSGEQRTSDLGWLAQNAEFYSIKEFLPDLGEKEFIDAIIDYTKRERRLGGRPKAHGLRRI